MKLRKSIGKIRRGGLINNVYNKGNFEDNAEQLTRHDHTTTQWRRGINEGEDITVGVRSILDQSITSTYVLIN